MLGLQSIVSIGKQSSNAAPTTLARKTLNIYSINGGVSENMPDDNLLGGGFANGSDPTPPAPGLPDHKLTIVAPICVNQLGFWLAAFFGTETVTGSSAPYTHAWASGAALPYVFLEHQLQTGDFRQHIGCVGEEFSIDLNTEKEGFAQVTMTFVGMDELTTTAALTGTIAAPPALLRPAEAICNINYNGASGGALMAGKFNYKRKLKRLRGADGTGIPYAIVQDGKASLDGSIHIRYQDGTFDSDAAARTERAMTMSLTMSSSASVTFGIPHMRLSRAGMDIKGPDGVEKDFNIKGWQNATDAAMSATVVNAAATSTI